MSLSEEITKAVGAHGLWKTRLRQAITTRTMEHSVEQIRADNQCEFGQWLVANATRPEMQSPQAKTVRQMHSAFHQVAARVAELALAGKKRQAEVMLTEQGEYSEASSKLTMAMMAWKGVP